MILGRPLVRAERVDSTMTWARAEVERGGAAPGAVYVAASQTAGRGRHGRSWHSAHGLGLYLTAVLPETLATPAVTLAAAVGVADAAERVCGVEAAIKWPNDLLAGGRKWGGVLAEVVAGPGGTAVLLGMGLNVAHGPADLGTGLEQTATSLRLATGRLVDGDALLTEVLVRVGERLGAFELGGFGAVAPGYLRRAALAPGDILELETAGGHVWSGAFRGLDVEGRLLVDGSPEPLASASVLSVRRRSA